MMLEAGTYSPVGNGASDRTMVKKQSQLLIAHRTNLLTTFTTRRFASGGKQATG